MESKPQKMQHLDRDLAMGWLIRQDDPRAKEIRDYIDRLRVLVRERDGLLEQLDASQDALQRIYWLGCSGEVEEIIIGVLTPEERARWRSLHLTSNVKTPSYPAKESDA